MGLRELVWVKSVHDRLETRSNVGSTGGRVLVGSAIIHNNGYARLSGKDRRFIKDQKYTPLSNRENLTLEDW